MPEELTHEQDERLLQERYSDAPWRLLVCCMLLNNTTRKQVNRVLDGHYGMVGLFERWPSSMAMQLASTSVLRTWLTPLGLQNRRAANLVNMSHGWQKLVTQPPFDMLPRWEHVAQLQGIGDYAVDSYCFFCLHDFSHFRSGDKELRVWLRHNTEFFNQLGHAVHADGRETEYANVEEMIERGW